MTLACALLLAFVWFVAFVFSLHGINMSTNRKQCEKLKLICCGEEWRGTRATRLIEWFSLRRAEIETDFLGENFVKWFSPIEADNKDGVITSEQAVYNGTLLYSSLREIYSKMKKQPRGESGELFNDGRGNTFYVLDRNNVLRSVYIRWDECGYGIEAYKV